MRVLILAAGRYDANHAAQIRAGAEPLLDVFELQAALGADLLDFRHVDTSTSLAVKAAKRLTNEPAALAVLGAAEREKYDAVLTTGEDIGMPLAALWKGRKAPAHTMIAHNPMAKRKQPLFKYLGVQDRIDCFLVYSSHVEQQMIEQLGIPARKIRRIYFHADDAFFKPDDTKVEPDLICSAGQLLRDYTSLIEAVRGLPVRLRIAAASPWISKELRPDAPLPANVEWGRYSRADLRALYARSALAVVPILQNDYQTGISTILEMMSMEKCVIATRTRGQTDTIVDGETGVYVPPGDPAALRAAIESLLADPARAARIGKAARKFIQAQASTKIFTEKIAAAVRESVPAGR